MGTKRPSCTLFDTLSNINTSDRKLHPGGKISRDPSPRPVMTAQSERERDSNREEDWRREREMEKTRDKTRYKDVNPRERYYEKAPPSRGREGDREWRERDRRQEDDTRRNGRPLSNLERDCEREVERGMKKGDTFPRMRKGSPEQRIKMMYTTEMDEEIQDGRPRDRPKRTETYFRENERGMVPQRERYRDRERDEIRGRVREEGQKSGGRPVDIEKSRHRDRYQDSGSGFQHRRREVSDSWDRRDRDAGRKREKPRPNMDGREARTSPHRQRDRDIYSDRREEAQRSQGRRDTRSEGDSDEREFRRERMRDREREELIYQHSKSEGDDRGKRTREKDQNRQGYRDEDRQRYTDRDRDRDGDRSRRKAVEKDRERYREGDRRAAREPDRQGERWKESGRDPRDDRGWSDDRYREYDQRRDRERKEREADPRRDDTTGRSSRSPNKMAPRVPPRSQSSGEWSSDMDSDQRYRYRYRDRDNLEERESGRDSTTENERDVDNQRDPQRAAERRQKEQKRSERQERDRGEMTDSVPEQRRMWLEPQRGKNSRDKFVDQERNTRRKERRKEEEEEEERSMEAQTEWGRERRHEKGEPDERYFDQSSYRERYEGTDESWREAEGVSVDGEEVGEVWRETNKERKEYLSDSSGGIEGRWLRDAEGESMTDNTEESDREEECGSNYTTQGRRESGWKQDRDSMVSTEDGFVTVSSGGDEEDEREEDEDAFEDCQEFLEGGVTYKGCLPGERQGEWTAGKEEVVDEEDQGGEEKPRVICVIGQTSRHSIHSDELLTQGVEGDNLNLERCRHSDNDVVAQQPQTDQHTAQSRNDDYPTINNQDTESKAERDTSREERVTTGETSEVYRRHRASSQLQDTETGEGMRSNAEIAQMKRDSQTERLLNEWREKNKELAKREMVQCPPVVSNPYADVCSQANIEKIQPILDELKAGVMSPEEEEAIRIRLSGAWSMSELPKRHSQAPHLKWAKDVVREILGHSEEKAVDEPTPHGQDDRVIDQSETVIEDKEQQEAVSRRETTDEAHSEPELEGEELLDVEGLRGMGESQTDMHADQFTTVHDDTPTHIHVDTPLDTAGKEEIDKEAKISGQLPLDKEDTKVTERGDEVMLSEIRKEEIRDKEVEMYLSVSNTLYKPSSCPILNYDSDSNLPIPSNEGKSQEEEDETDESEEEWQKGEPGGRDISAEVGKMGVGERSGVESKEGEMVVDSQIERGTATSTSSFRDLGPEARFRRRGIRKTTQRSNGEHEKVEEEEEGVGRDRRTRIFSITDDEDDRSKSWAEVDLRNILDTLGRRKRNSRIFNAQLYQQYSEAAQNFEILRQARSDVVSVCEDNPPSPVPSPPPARRPLPPLPPVPHPHSLSHTGSVTSVKSLPLPDRPKTEDRPSSPRLSISIGTQSSLLWRDLPGVRDSGELDMLTEDQRRLQEVRFEVVTSEASYCRSLDIVVEHFVKSKQLGALLTTQDRNWLFSRLADVRAISHSFLSKLEERMEKDIVHFTVCDIIARQCQRFKMVYVPYLTNQSYQDATYQRLMNENPGFKQIVEKLERSPVCQRLPLRSFLVLPFQRITRIKLLVQNIVKRTTPGTTEATQAIKAMRLLEKLIQESNDSISQMKNIESLVSLSAKVDFECRTLPLISQSRRLLREGLITQLMDFSLKETERSVYLHLFNDYLLLSLQKEGGRFTVIDHCPVLELRVENCRVKLHSLQKNLFRLYMSNKSLLLRTDTQGDKLRWISALSLPHPEVDFSTSQDVDQMQCIRAFVAQQPDELSLEKADVILVHQQSSDNWVEGTRLSDRHRGWVRESHLETITNAKVRQRNLSDALKLTTATAAV